MARVQNKEAVMKYYQEINAIKGTGINENVILSDICGIIHNVLGLDDSINVGISFPKYSYNSRRDTSTLGCTMRVFANTKEELEKLGLQSRLEALDDYINLSGIELVGDKATHYEVYTRCRQKNVQKKAEKLYNHYLKKHGEQKLVECFGDFQGVVEHCEKTNTKFKRLPFITAVSNSNGEPYIIKLKRRPVDKPSRTFKFNNFGISVGSSPSTVPAW